MPDIDESTRIRSSDEIPSALPTPELPYIGGVHDPVDPSYPMPDPTIETEFHGALYSSSSNAADVNAKNHLGDVKLHAAIRKGERAEVAALLADPEINVNIAGINGDTALHLATNRKLFVDLLLTKPNIRVNALNDKNNTPLFDALLSGDLTDARALIAKGAYVNVVNDDGLTPVHIAVGTQRRVPLEAVIEGIRQQAKEGTHNTILINRYLEKIDTIKTDNPGDWHKDSIVKGSLLLAVTALDKTPEQKPMKFSAEQQKMMLAAREAIAPSSIIDRFMSFFNDLQSPRETEASSSPAASPK